MSITVDARGRSCPEPVIMTKTALEKAGGGSVTVLTDTAVARDNVSRMAGSLGWKSTVQENDGEFTITCTR